MSDLLPQGNYSNCTLQEAVIADSEFGPQWNLTFNVDGVNRTVYLSLDEDYTYSNGKKAIEATVETLQALGFNGKSSDPKFSASVYDPGIELYCKHAPNQGGVMKERWYISNGFKATPASKNVLSGFDTRWKAMTGGNPKPAGAKPSPTPTRPSSAPQRSSSAPTRPGTSRVLLAKNSDEAWTYVCEKRKDMTSEVYFKGIEEQEKQSGRKEADFVAEDWHEVATFLTLPECPF